jgi:hypothetical protein
MGGKKYITLVSNINLEKKGSVVEGSVSLEREIRKG